MGKCDHMDKRNRKKIPLKPFQSSIVLLDHEVHVYICLFLGLIAFLN